MADAIPEFKHTAIDTIPATVSRLRATFNSQKTRPVAFRLAQLRKLYWGFVDNEKAIIEALRLDLGKGTYEAFISDLDWCKNDIVFVTKNLEKWAKDEKPPDIPFVNSLLSPKIRKDPLGCVLVIGTYNFPFQLTISPLIGAIAAGNTVVIKPSENCPACSAVMEKIVADTLDPGCYTTVQGAVPETTALLDQAWDKIFYTGSLNVARIIARKAADSLTPVTLELGGKNPAIVTAAANIKIAAKRLVWGKTFNAGQVCVSQNYTLIDRSILAPFVAEVKAVLAEFYPAGARASPDYGRIVNARQWARLRAMLAASQGTILAGGAMDEADRFLEPTVIQVEDVDDAVIREESFGPILALFPVDDLSAAIRIANEVHATPLGAYAFGSARETDRVMRELRSGGATVNDAWFHLTIPTLPFGGVGDSGAGNYRGRASFDCFTHRRSMVRTPGWMEMVMGDRYPPYAGKLVKIQGLANLKPDFDRQGRVRGGMRRWLGVGVVAAALAALGVRQYL